MQLDRTKVVVRERSQLELLDLALRVIVQNLPALAFALATATLHGVGIGFARLMQRASLRPLVRLAGAACAVLGVALVLT